MQAISHHVRRADAAIVAQCRLWRKSYEVARARLAGQMAGNRFAEMCQHFFESDKALVYYTRKLWESYACHPYLYPTG
jgi:hypothetical protein